MLVNKRFILSIFGFYNAEIFKSLHKDNDFFAEFAEKCD